MHRRILLALPAAVALAGCGSLSADELPPAATPATPTQLTEPPDGRVYETDVRRRNALTLGLGRLEANATKGPPLTVKADDGETTLRLLPRARRLTASGRVDGSVGAGVGPAGVATDGGRMAYVTDAVGDGVAVVQTRPTFAVTRRVGLPGSAPWDIAYDKDRGRLWVTLTATNEVAELAAGARPRELRRYPAIRGARTVEVAKDGSIVVASPDAVQVLQPED